VKESLAWAHFGERLKIWLPLEGGRFNHKYPRVLNQPKQRHQSSFSFSLSSFSFYSLSLQVILTHSYSRVVMQTLTSLAQTKRISVYVTESRPAGLGLKTHSELLEAGIPSTLVLDSAVAYTLPRCDMVLVGAEGVAESGGVINAIGTYQIALIAKALGKPFYCAAER